ncbi:hypothetical protein AAEX28_12845 [Lentisphaerota bacterium WC36G]|nr:hypothetical protein LJT99_15665 [Lentisphaerae bacterium WC36]
MMEVTDLEEHAGLFLKFCNIVAVTIGPSFKSKDPLNIKITKEIVHNFENEFKKDFNTNNKTLLKEIKEKHEKLNEYIKKLEEIDSKIASLRDEKDDRSKEKIEKKYGKVINLIINNNAYKIMFSETELKQIAQKTH